MPRPSHDRTRYLGALALAAALPAVLYLLSLYPGVGDRSNTGDAIEFQFVGRILSVPHESGYPQYVLLSYLWSKLPLPLSLASRINLLSAVFSLCAGLFFFHAARSLSRSDAAAVVSTWFLLTAPNLWLLSTQAEVYTLNALWVAAVLWAALRWDRSGNCRDLALLLLFYALSFGNHLTMITLLPALVFLVLARDAKVVLRWQIWAWATVAILAGLVQYGLLAWRSYNPHPTLLRRFPRQATLGQLYDYVAGGRMVGKHFLKTGLTDWPARLWEASLHSVGQLTLPFLLLCCLGLYVACRRDRRQTVFLGLITGCVLAFAAAYGIKDSLYYTIPAWFCLALWGATGLGKLLDSLPQWRYAISGLLVLFLALRIVPEHRRLRVDENPAGLEAVIAAAPPGSVVVADPTSRRARLLHHYYRYGLGLDKAAALRFRSLTSLLRQSFDHLGTRPVYLQNPRIDRQLRRRLVDTVRLPAAGTQRSVYRTGAREPLGSLILRPGPRRGFLLEVRHQSRLLTEEGTLYLFSVSAPEHRANGLLAFETDRR